MGKLHKEAKKLNLSYHVLDKDTFEATHPLGTQAEAAYDAKKASEKALKEAEEAPVIPMPDEEEIARVRRRRSARRGGGRESTVLTDYGLGG